MELDVIAACFIGGARPGRRGLRGRCRDRRLRDGVMNNGMSPLGIGIDVQQVIKGLVLLAAVCFDDVLQRRRDEARLRPHAAPTPPAITR